MSEAAKVPGKAEQKSEGKSQPQAWRPFETLRREVDRLFDDFGTEFWRAPSRRSLFEMVPPFRRTLDVGPALAVDIIEKDNAYEVTADYGRGGADRRSS